MLIISFDIKGIVHNEFALAGQTINSAYYCEVLFRLHENVQRALCPELWQPQNWLLPHDNALLFSPGNFFYQKQLDCHPPPTLLACLGPLRLFCFFD
jgi:hypothetical protein